jgi:hypothetical protein
MNNYNTFCKDSGCKEYIEWNYHDTVQVSCKKIGESENICQIPEDCAFTPVAEKTNE